MSAGDQLQSLLQAGRGYAVAGVWLLVVAVAFSAPAAIAWCLAMKRGRR